MSEIVLDASVLLAILKDEPYDSSVLEVSPGAIMSSINLAEVLGRATDLGLVDSPHLGQLLAMLGGIEPLTEFRARLIGGLREQTRHLGLSIAGRACLALAVERSAEVYTADRQWAAKALPCPIRLIR